jgi:hypothetical protein
LAKVGAKNRMKKKYLVLGLMFIFVQLVIASCPENPGECDYGNPEDLESLIIDNIEGVNWDAINADQLSEVLSSHRVEEVIENIPNSQNEKLMSALNNNPFTLLKNEKVFERVNQITKEQPNFLNKNHAVKFEWFSNYGIKDLGGNIKKFDGETVVPLGKDGEDQPSSFNIVQLRENEIKATLLSNGVLKIGRTLFTESSVTINKYENGDVELRVQGGITKIDTTNPTTNDYRFYIVNGKLTVNEPSKEEGSWKEREYKGSFLYWEDKEGDQHFKSANSEEELKISHDVITVRKFDERTLADMRISAQIAGIRFEDYLEKQKRSESKTEINVKGEIIVNDEFNVGEMILVSNTKVSSRGEEIEVSNDRNTRVYYTQFNDRGAGRFCQQGHSCVINTRGEGTTFTYRARLAVNNVQNNDQITVKSYAYISHVEVDDIQNGEVIIISEGDPSDVEFQVKDLELERAKESMRAFLNQEKQENYRSITISKSSDQAIPKVTSQGNLGDLKFGRFDLTYTENGKEMLKHWSTNNFQESQIKQYFQGLNRGNTLTTCQIGIDCAYKLAENFGEIITPPRVRTTDAKNGNWVPSTTIILAGGQSPTTNLKRWCYENGGCYMYNSRDTPTQIKTQSMFLAGHHYNGNDYMWRDHQNLDDEFATHSPTDNFYYSPTEGGSQFDHFPTDANNCGDNGQQPCIKTITFGSCNSVIIPKQQSGDTYNTDNSLTKLIQAYPNLDGVVGWEGAAPLAISARNAHRPYLNTEDFTPLSTNKGEKGIIFKHQNEWYWTSDKMSCIKIGSSEGTTNCPGTRLVAANY